MSESDISTSVKNGVLYLEDPFDQVYIGFCRRIFVQTGRTLRPPLLG